MNSAFTLLTYALLSVSLTAQTLVGDGQADDTAALQKLVDAGGSVALPKGRYRLTKTVTVDLAKLGAAGISSDGTATLIMAGPGPALKIVGTHGGTAAPKSFKPETWAQRTPVVQGLEIVGAHAEADGIEANGTMQLTLSRLTIRECRHGIRLAVRNRNVVIADCHLYRNRGVGLFLDNVNLHQTNVTGCHISYNLGGGIVAIGGEVRNLHVEDSQNIVITGNNFDRNPRYLVNGNGLAEKNGVLLRRVADSAFSGNVVVGVHGKEAAVDVEDGTRLRITDNSILDSDGHALRLTRLSRSLVTGNLLRDDRREKHRGIGALLVVREGAENRIDAEPTTAR